MSVGNKYRDMTLTDLNAKHILGEAMGWGAVACALVANLAPVFGRGILEDCAYAAAIEMLAFGTGVYIKQQFRMAAAFAKGFALAEHGLSHEERGRLKTTLAELEQGGLLGNRRPKYINQTAQEPKFSGWGCEG